MTSYPGPPKTIEELDERLEFQYEAMGRPDTWEEDRLWMIKLYNLKEDTHAK